MSGGCVPYGSRMGAMNDFWWYVSRSTGIMATVLTVFSLSWGFLFSSRQTGKKLRPAWWLDLHKWLGGLALAFIVIHIVAVFADSDLAIGVKQIFVPGTAGYNTTAITFGVISTYLFALAIFTSWPKMRFPKRVWRAIHLTSVAAVVFAGLHGYQAGTDGPSLVFKVALVVVGGLAVYPLSLRILGVAAARQSS